MLFRLIEPSQVNECELVGHTDQQFSDITLKLPNAPVIRSIPNIHGRYIKQIQWFKKKQFKKSKIKNSTISKLKDYVDQKFDEACCQILNNNFST